jgi:RNA polymerase sigma-70 factor (ECF subfamily)
MTSRPIPLDEHPRPVFASLLAKTGLVSSPKAHPRLLQEIDQPQKDSLSTFNTLILQHQDAAYNFAFYLLGDPDAAEDAAQQAFIKAYLHFDQFQGTNFRSWLFKILKNACIDEIRREKRRQVFSLNTLEDREKLESKAFPISGQMLTPEQAVDQKETSRRIQAALSHLEESFRTVLILVDIQGMDYQEAAQVINIPLGTLKSRLARARRQFRNVLEQ